MVAVLAPSSKPREEAASAGASASATTAATPSTTTAAAATTTLAPSERAEVDRPGDEANPGQRYPDRPDRRENDQERAVGADPARLSGYSAYVLSNSAERAGPDGRAGRYVKIVVRLVNRDDSAQPYRDRHWTLRRPDGVVATTAFATPAFVQGGTIAGNGETFGELWFETPADGRYWLAFRPDAGSARGIWLAEVEHRS